MGKPTSKVKRVESEACLSVKSKGWTVLERFRFAELLKNWGEKISENIVTSGR